MIFAYSNLLFTIKKQIRFFRKAKTIHDVDSPFIYHFCKYIIEDKRNFYIFPLGQLLYKEAKKAGRKSFSMPPLTGKRLFRSIHYFKPEIAVEVGAGDGLSTIYQATAMLSGDLFSLEEEEERATYARQQINELGLPNVELYQGEAISSLSRLRSKIDRIDFFFAAKHCPPEQLPTILKQIDKVLGKHSVLVVGGIYQSPERWKCWQQLKATNKVRLSIDLFDLGFLFFDPNHREKQDYCLLPSRLKPWRLGLFR